MSLKRLETEKKIKGIISEKEFKEIFNEAENFYNFVKNWIKENYPKYA